MVGFEIFVNGEKRLTAGGEEYQFLNALVGLIKLPLPEPDDTAVTFAASGITEGQARVALWPSLILSVGDAVEIRVVQLEAADPPESVQTPGAEGADADA